jgi:hypothetical protein
MGGFQAVLGILRIQPKNMRIRLRIPNTAFKMPTKNKFIFLSVFDFCLLFTVDTFQTD